MPATELRTRLGLPAKLRRTVRSGGYKSGLGSGWVVMAGNVIKELQ